ncbi:hypothetical protein [Acinetobacter sp. Marseille-Q1618]|uniref:hypothetical protein n=1 Tax=Acinetobacter sp. Marseille-Q1618 TaxID=2697502 RepID=UPI001570285B|nr:hypothetical protein [Acinetobacter sp. Marseille-Q1618]
MLIKSKPLLFILFISIIFLILFNSQKNKDGLDQSLELIHFYALQGRPDAQFELATRIEQAVQNQTQLSDQQIFPKKLLDFSYQLFFDHSSAEPSVLDRFFEPIYSNSAEALA